MSFLMARQLLLLFCFLGVSLHAELRIQVNRIENLQRIPFETENRLKWAWTLNKEKVRVLTPTISLRSQEFSNFSEVKTQNKNVKALLKGQQLLMQLGGLNEKILLKSPNKKMFLEIVGKFNEGSAVIDENCEAQKIVLRSVSKTVPFYIGTSCETKEGTQALTLSFPKEADIGNATLFEIKGKGEPWRYYELGSARTGTKLLGKFNFRFQGKGYDFLLESLNVEKDKNQEIQPITLMGGAGFSMLKISGTDIDVSDSKPDLLLKVPHYPIWRGLGVALDLDFAIPLSKGDKAITYTQFGVYFNYQFILGTTFIIRPKLGYVVTNHTNDTTQIGINANTLGVGTTLELAVGANYVIALDLMSFGFGSKGVSSHYLADISLLHKSANSIGWGFGVRTQAFKTLSELGIERSFGQNLVYGLVGF